MITVAESRLTIIVIISYTLSFWLLVTVIIQIFAGCPEYDPISPTADECPFGTVMNGRFRFHFMGALIVQAHLALPSDEFVCDVTIVSRYWSLTPAQCTNVFQKRPREFIVILSDSSNWQLNAQEHHIHQYLVHRNYFMYFHDYDIAMVKVIEPFIGARTSYAVLPAPACWYDVTSPGTVLTWRIGRKNATVAGGLRKVRARILDSGYYEAHFRDLKWFMSRRTLRVGEYTPMEGMCFNKRGALLLQNETAIGINVETADCASNSSFDVYVNLAYFKESIQYVMDNYKTFSAEKCEELTDFVPTFVQAQVRASVPGYARRKTAVS